MKKKTNIVNNKSTMKVITSNPIYKNGKKLAKHSVTINSPKRGNISKRKLSNFDNDDMMSYATDTPPFLPTINGSPIGSDSLAPNPPAPAPNAVKKGGIDSTKVADNTNKILDAFSKGAKTYSDVVNVFKKNGQQIPTPDQYTAAKNKSSQAPMTTTTKVLIAVAFVGGLIIVGMIAKKLMKTDK